MIILDYRDRRPIYEQIMKRFQELMVSGVMEQDSQLPSVRSLAMDLSINPNTIQRAYGELERQGYIYTVKGKGNFASDRENLLGRYKEEILKQLKEICRTALSVGMTETEIIDNIRGWGKL